MTKNKYISKLEDLWNDATCGFFFCFLSIHVEPTHVTLVIKYCLRKKRIAQESYNGECVFVAKTFLLEATHEASLEDE